MILNCQAKCNLQENTEYEITIDWFGGYLTVNTLYENGEFKVLDEDYSTY